MKTRQSIVDAREAISQDAFEQKRLIDQATRKKVASVQSDCAEVGHVFSKSTFLMSTNGDRYCLFCHAVEPSTETFKGVTHE